MRRLKDEPRWLRRALRLSVLLHALVAGGLYALTRNVDADDGPPSPVDIELAPEAPKAEQLAAEKEIPIPALPPPEPASTIPQLPPITEPGDIAIDAGAPDAAPDARIHYDARPRPDAREHPDAPIDAGVPDDDAGVPDDAQQMIAGAPAEDAGAPLDGGETDGGAVAATDTGAGSGSGSGSDEGSASDDSATGVTASSVSAGTGANLLSYFPKGHVVTLLLRFDRLRGTEWAAATETLLAPMPDYQTIIGDRAVHIADVFDTLVISTPRPRDIDATTLVGRTAMAPADLRALLDHDGANVAWSPAAGGALGRRRPGPRMFAGDRRVFLSPFTGWIVLAQPGDLGTLTRPGRGDLDTLVAPDDALPDWLRRVRAIETESGAPTGPALVLTMAALAGRYELPDLGLGVTSLPAPDRITLAIEVDKHGFVLRGNLHFASDADAKEMTASLTAIHDQVVASHLLQAVLGRTHLLNLVKGLSAVRTGRRVAYATSVSISDARELMAVAAQMVGDYYAGQRVSQRPPAPKQPATQPSQKP